MMTDKGSVLGTEEPGVSRVSFSKVTVSGRNQIADARRRRLLKQARQQATRKARLDERERRLAEDWRRHRRRMAERQQRLDDAHRERQRRHRAEMAKRNRRRSSS